MLQTARLAQSQTRFDEAEAAFRQALAVDDSDPDAWIDLGNVLKSMARLDEAVECFNRALAIDPDRARAQDDYLSTLYVHPGYDGGAILQEHRKWGQRQAKLYQRIATHANDRSPDRRIRVGYVSPHFCGHANAFYLLPLFNEHDHKDFEIFCYSDVTSPDALTGRLREHADGWREIAGAADERVIEMIREDRIDCLIDLASHIAGNRLPMFARHPAPVQISWLGYPGTTGLEAMDYRLTDPYLDPPGETDGQYVEKSIRLPRTFWCYHPLTDRPAVNPLPALDKGWVTFGCLNNFCKINEATIRRWARVLGAVPDSRMIVMAPEGSARQWARSIFSRGEPAIDAGRVEFVSYQPRPQYLATYQRIDIGLDALPYNGHTTSLDAMWMGVPVVTQVGSTVVGRGGWSQSCSLEMEELAGWTEDQFVRIAADLATDLPRLRLLREGLRPKLERSPLMDARRSARGLEDVYRSLWRNYCATVR
jgi:predicted O-linked N-acetylglucosamine transferase (SPINDLY family)